MAFTSSYTDHLIQQSQVYYGVPSMEPGLSGSFSGSFQGDGSGLTNLPASFGKFGIANTNGEYTYYSDLSSSLQASTAGDTIQLFTNVTEASDHTFHLKDKVDFNFNGNELFISASATLDAADMITDNDVAVSCSFYNGRIRFTQGTGANIFNRLLYIDNVASEITSIGFEWEVENGINATPYQPIKNDGTLNGGKFIGGPDIFNYLIETYACYLQKILGYHHQPLLLLCLTGYCWKNQMNN